MAVIYTEEDFIDEGKEIRVGKFLEHRKLNMHAHEFWELSYVNEGKGAHYFEDGTKSPIKPDEFLFTSPGMSHCIVSPANMRDDWVRVTNLLIRHEFFNDLKKDLLKTDAVKDYKLINMINSDEPFCLLLNDEYGIISGYLRAVEHEYKFYSKTSGIMIKNAILNIIIYIIRLYEGEIREKKVIDANENAINDLIGFVQANFGSNLTLDYLAAYMHLSPAYLSRYFKKHTGVKLSDFIVGTRMDYAKKLLASGSVSIQDISVKCGYNDLSVFQKAFKKHTGMSAGEYRKSHRHI